MKVQRVNMDINKRLWKEVGIKAIEEGITKKELVEKALTNYIKEETMKMKNLTIRKAKKWDHIIGKEINETYTLKGASDLPFYIDLIYADLDGETVDAHEDELDSINTLQIGEYHIDQGDFDIFVTIEDFE